VAFSPGSCRTSRRLMEKGRWRFGATVTTVKPLSAIADQVVLIKVICVHRIFTAIQLPLPPCRREVTFLTLPPTSHTWRVAWVVHAAQVAFHLPSATWNAGLIDALVLRLLCLWRSWLAITRAIGRARDVDGSQWLLRGHCRHRDTWTRTKVAAYVVYLRLSEVPSIPSILRPEYCLFRLATPQTTK
jgi:hypothetical protein